MTRKEILDQCRDDALTLLETTGKVKEAISCMLSDLNKHDETIGEITPVITAVAVEIAQSGDVARARDFIEGFK